MIPPRAPQKQMQEDNMARACDLKRCTCDIACASYEEEEEIHALVSSHVMPEADEDWGVQIGRLVCSDD